MHLSCPSTILIADGAEQSRSVLAGLLRTAGYATIEAADGVSALNCLQQERLDAALVDLLLPRLPSLESLEARLAARHVPLILMGGNGRAPLERLRTAADYFLCKPVRSQELLATVRQALDRRRGPGNNGLARELEEQHRQVRKLAALGQLAGGMAHDFNNLLMVILGYGELLRHGKAPGQAEHDFLDEIVKASERGVALTRQLLAFSRKHTEQPRLLDLNALVANLCRMLRRLLGTDVELVSAVAPRLRPVCGEATQLELVLMNLAINARDAMPRGGTITVATTNVEGPEAVRQGVPAGSYVVLAVSDTGCGMTEEVRARLFEPFFTTKEKGRGTGLGLATVHNIVTQHGGQITVSSAPGQGSTFRVYLPAILEPAATLPLRRESDIVAGGTETILLVEDEETVRVLLRHILSGQGYTVLVAAGAPEALRIGRDHPGRIDLVISDLLMPHMRGDELVRRLTELRPALPVLYITGLGENLEIDSAPEGSSASVLHKPFPPEHLARKVRELLDQRRPKDSASAACG
jgi:signal transduction histidine kinase